MSYHPRIECKKRASLITTRCRNSELWFVNNDSLEKVILGLAAKYRTRYDVKPYALAIEGNHIHMPAHFPGMNRSSFMRDFNSTVARAVPRYAPEYPGGRLFGRRYSNEFLADNKDIEDYFFYTVLQPVKDGLVEKISDYPGYNCFHDAVYGIERKFKVVRWGEYNAAKRYNPKVPIKNFTDIVTLKYERLPGYEHLSQREYAKYMHDELEKRRLEIVQERYTKGLGFAGRTRLLQTKRGKRPKNTKVSTPSTPRPRVLSRCHKRRAEERDWYFQKYFRYKEASHRYRAGELDVEFPEGMYKPYIPVTRPDPPK